MNFPEWLQKQLDERGWNQSDLARAAGVARGSIGNIMRGERGAGPELLKAIAIALGVPETEVFQLAGLMRKNHSINDRSARLAYRISQLPAEDQETIDAMIDGLYNRRKNRGEIIDLPNNAAPGEA